MQDLINKKLLRELLYRNERFFDSIRDAFDENFDIGYGMWQLRHCNGDSSEKHELIGRTPRTLCYGSKLLLLNEMQVYCCQKETSLLLWCCFSGRIELTILLVRNSRHNVIPHSILYFHLMAHLAKAEGHTREIRVYLDKNAARFQDIANETLKVTPPKIRRFIMRL